MIGGIVCSLAVIWGIHFVWSGSKIKYPPTAPHSLPFLGHILQLLKPIAPQELFRQWSLTVGPVFTVNLGAKRWVILNSLQAVQDLIVGKGTVYSSRDMPGILIHDLMGGENGGGFAFYPYGPPWRKLRRIAHGGLTKAKIGDYQPILDHQRSVLLANVKKSMATQSGPVELAHVLEHYTMTSILAIMFGSMCHFEPEDKRLHQGFALTEDVATVFGPLEQAANFFPLLRYILPDSKAKCARIRRDLEDFYGGLLDQYRQCMDQGQVEDCFIKSIIDTGEMSDVQMMAFLANFVGAGSETTASTLGWMIALLANHPDIQDKVYDEIREKVGLETLPTADDEHLLPYLQCVIHETLRLKTPAPLSVPHATSQDDVYKGWVIPKDTTVIINLHAIHQDPALYHEPLTFNPDRHWDYVTESANGDKRGISQSTGDRPHLAFSTGRRVCVGIHLAERSVFMAASALLATFRFECPDAARINVDMPKDLNAPTFTPPPYKVSVVPRAKWMQERP
ncbi:cytochrome P450 [Hesseltinella vesiculosa]|uniref:Cytochrome P450 n=1 Tax=Hesseltinella vesiculosa TaxID=101127 RepID=A0A1X2G563_9FUNG|nr:cytochrome P450 [Hesseltinella vesiculosa]